MPANAKQAVSGGAGAAGAEVNAECAILSTSKELPVDVKTTDVNGVVVVMFT